MSRVILIVLDSVGIGELPDAAQYGDRGSNTLLNIKKSVPSMNLVNMNNMGLSNIDGAELLSDFKIENPTATFCKAAELSKGKDTTVGHWEIAGVIVENPFPTYPNGFPTDLIEKFEKTIGRGIIGNCVASGTEIISKLGDKHVETGKLILYTSADSVFQVAAHENVVPIAELYGICQKARDLLVDEHAVSRVIARPFVGEHNNYTRTRNRKDFSLRPIRKTMLEYIKEAGQSVSAIGKIEDIFAGEGITNSIHTIGNMDGVNKTLDNMNNIQQGLIFTNLVDFDMIYGHRNDVRGYAQALVDFDNRLPEIIEKLLDDDILIITADHGCDPVTESTDHSREYIPILIYGKCIKRGLNLHIRNSFADIGATIMDYLGVSGEISGESFLDLAGR